MLFYDTWFGMHIPPGSGGKLNFLLISGNEAAYAQFFDVFATIQVQRDLEHCNLRQAFPFVHYIYEFILLN